MSSMNIAPGKPKKQYIDLSVSFHHAVCVRWFLTSALNNTTFSFICSKILE
jgi:hypothetical protein